MSQREFPDSRDRHRQVVTFAATAELGRGGLEAFAEIAAVALDTKPETFNHSIHFTSLDDGTHGNPRDGKSYHYIGFGYDLRFRGIRHGGIVIKGIEGQLAAENLSEDEQLRYLAAQFTLAGWWVARMQLALKGRWQIILESDHIHAEKDPGG